MPPYVDSSIKRKKAEKASNDLNSECEIQNDRSFSIFSYSTGKEADCLSPRKIQWQLSLGERKWGFQEQTPCGFATQNTP
ncbi:MAG: hypothetical protein IJD39_06730 [Clostridia bacterium]|nr:hypothetical protein [Clostridia bacterium]